MNVAAVPSDIRLHLLQTAQLIMGRKGFSAVGLTEILSVAKVPKGSFYHYFESKEAFGEALLEAYFSEYMGYLDALLTKPGTTAADRLLNYFSYWLETQASDDPEGKCLAVKLGAEVSDLSEAMRTVLQRGTQQIVERLAACIEAGVADGSLMGTWNAHSHAMALYELWLGASLLAKITRNRNPLVTAMATTRQLLLIPGGT
ncbi:TetR/AcrR family transcriptional regulator [Dyella tabacisoli]|uniref:TetR/AcrR family transcriptional regulator n=1 Tax=Dyella tabacisoli TaxID=2282381 RepID=A0A369ULB2_9GAMM|nr:TetR/AcrR family transcriptional regulator [Dyella tabacisoli]RDD81297.1 TetR/AcrR family transcriptional regulator [Dyella tabacisoli]